MTIIKSEHIDFVPSKYVEKHNDIIGDCIYVFSRKCGTKIYKKKHRCVGVIIWSKDTKDYGYVTFGNNVNLSEQTLRIIYHFVASLNKGEIKYDKKECQDFGESEDE